MGSFKTLKDFFVKHKWKYLLGVVWLLIVDIVQLIIPQILRAVTNLIEKGTLTTPDLIKYAIYIILTGLVIGLGRYYWRIYIMGTSYELEYYIRNRLFRHLQTLSTNYFNKHKTGDLMAHGTEDINRIRMALGPGIVMITDAIFMTIAVLIIMMYTTDLKLAILALIPLPFLAITIGRFGKIIFNRSKLVQESFSDLSDKAQENFSGIRVVKSFVQEEREIQKFTESNHQNFKANMHLIKIHGLFDPIVNFISSISYLIVIWYGGTLVIRGTISLGDFVAFLSYLGLLVWPMMAIGFVINILQRGAASMERINNIMSEKPDIYDNDDIIDKSTIQGEIEFKNVSFKYPGSTEYALKDVSLKVPKGSTLGVVGRTGSGKTTIISLLLRLFEIEEGEILVDGVNVSKISLKTLRENIGYVSQDNFLFSNSIKENISFAFDNELDDEQIYEAAEISQVYDNIMEFPKKFDTSLGERGVTLSGGQRQRTALARAIIKDPDVLILDDSLSAVDTHTEEKILANLEKVLADKTNILIAHRLSTVKNANEIVVFDEGKIVERGTHEELLVTNGLYNDIYQKQLLEEKIRNE